MSLKIDTLNPVMAVMPCIWFGMMMSAFKSMPGNRSGDGRDQAAVSSDGNLGQNPGFQRAIRKYLIISM
jgi:hypothetical protein